jgi:hypothetical protein
VPDGQADPVPADPVPDVLAAVLVALHRVVLSVVRSHVLDGADARADAALVSARAFAALAPETLAFRGERP